MKEKKLIKEAKNGDKKAFEELILYYHKDLYKIARTRLSKEDDINDAIQDTILMVFKSLEDLRDISKFRSWLITILINQCNSIYKKNNLSSFISYESINAEKIYTENLLHTDIEFYSLIDKVDTDERTILILHYIENYKFKEIANILQMNEATVRSKFFRAKKKIQNDMKEDDYNE